MRCLLVFLTFLLALALAAPPTPPTLTYPAPGRVVVTWTKGDCAWKSYGNSGVWLGCDGRAELPGPPPIDRAVVPHDGDRVWVVGAGGERSGVVVVGLPWWGMVPVVRR